MTNYAGVAPVHRQGVLEHFPTQPGAWRVERRNRDVRDGQLNLKSNELLHPDVLLWCRERLAELDPHLVAGYPVLRTARRAVGRHFDRPRTEILLTPGTDFAIRLVCEALCLPAGRLVLAAPHFERWTSCAAHLGFAVETVPSGHREPVKVEQIAARLRAGSPAVVVLTQPDGTTGQVYSREEIAVVSHAAAAHGSLLVLDTCYLAFTPRGENTLADARDVPHVLRINSFSKGFGLAGARIGALLGPAPVIDYLARWHPENMVGGPGAHLLIRALTDIGFFQSVWNDVVAVRELLARAVTHGRNGWSARTSGANFVAFDAPRRSAEEAHGALLAAGIRTRLLTGEPGFDGGLRIATPARAAVDRVCAALALPCDSKGAQHV